MAKRKSVAASSLGGGIAFIIAGLVFFFVSLGIISDAKKFGETAQETTAVVTDVERRRVRRNGKYRTDYDVYVQYEVGGITYNEELSGGNSSMREGETLKVYYDPLSPRDVRSSNKITVVHGLTAIFPVVFIVAGISMGIVPSIKSSKRRKLKETGEQVSAVITEVILDTSIKINKRHPYKALCEAVDPLTGERYLYSSEGFMDDIRYLKGQTVTVYYDPDDKGKYYVDLDSADENSGMSAVHDYR